MRVTMTKVGHREGAEVGEWEGSSGRRRRHRHCRGDVGWKQAGHVGTPHLRIGGRVEYPEPVAYEHWA